MSRHAELLTLCGEALDGTLSPEQQSRLEAILRHDLDAQAYYVQFFQLDACLQWHMASASMSPGELVVPVGVTPHPIRRRPLVAAFQTVSRHIPGGEFSVGTLVVLVVVAAFWGLASQLLGPRHLDAEVTSVARIRSEVGARWIVNQPQQGSTIPPHTPLEIDSGLVEMELEQGVVLVIEGPAKWTIEGSNCASLRSGKLVARVPREAIGFALRTPSARIVDLGTEFGVWVESDDRTEAKVFRGKIEIEVDPPRNDVTTHPVKQQLNAGEVANIERRVSGGVAIQVGGKSNVSFAREASDGPDGLADKGSEYSTAVVTRTRPVAYWSLNTRSRLTARDLVASLEFASFAPTEAGVAGPRPGDGLGSMAADNRALLTDGSGSVAYGKAKDVLGLDSSSYSMQIWIRSDIEFAAQPISYLLGRGNGWQVNVDLRDCVGVLGNYPTPGIKPGCLVLYSGDAARPLVGGSTVLKPHRWHHVLLVRQRDEIRIYLDGALEVSGTAPWAGGDGNRLAFGHRIDALAGIGLVGRFDEAAVWNRALSDEEVKWIYEAAKGLRASGVPADRQSK